MPRRGEARLRVAVIGAGKVGTVLSRALRSRGVEVVLRSARARPPGAIDADVILLAARERDLPSIAERLRGAVSPRTVVLHVAGALGPGPLASLRGACAGVAQMHPLLSFASERRAPTLEGATVHVNGDPVAVARARQLARLLGMRPRTVERLDTALYHAAAGLVANGAAALASVGADLLVRAGADRALAPAMLGPLLRSVAENVEALGFPDALTGPVRRGDVAGLERHLAVVRAKLPRALPLYLAVAQAQLPLARAIGDAPEASFRAIQRALTRHRRWAPHAETKGESHARSGNLRGRGK
jgi:predicted short-subunit dehydrogenase-like oxidoreductase (DUF2520 family)